MYTVLVLYSHCSQLLNKYRISDRAETREAEERDRYQARVDWVQQQSNSPARSIKT